jgi:hypothetical protein
MPHSESPGLIVSVHGLPWLYFEPLKLLNLDFIVVPDPDLDSAFHSIADPDPAFNNNADQCGSGSATLFETQFFDTKI